MGSELVRIWNECVRATASLDHVSRLLGARRLREVLPGARDFLVTEDGFFVRLPLARAQTCVQAVGICVNPRYFQPPGFVPQIGVTRLAFDSVSLTGSASDVLRAMRSAGLVPVDVMADQELFTIVYGASLVLEFLPDGDWAVDPESSSLATVQFNFGPRYTGRVEPLLENLE